MTTFQLSPLPATCLFGLARNFYQALATKFHPASQGGHRSFYGIGCFSEETLFLPESTDHPDKAGQKCAILELHKFSEEVVKRIAPKFSAAELALFEQQIKTPAFKDGATHLLMH